MASCFFSCIFKTTRNYGALRAPPLLAPAPKGHYTHCAKILAPKKGVDTHGFDSEVKRNRLSQKKIFRLGQPLMASRPLEGSGGPDTVRDHWD